MPEQFFPTFVIINGPPSPNKSLIGRVLREWADDADLSIYVKDGTEEFGDKLKAEVIVLISQKET